MTHLSMRLQEFLSDFGKELVAECAPEVDDARFSAAFANTLARVSNTQAHPTRALDVKLEFRHVCR
jgi:hypothetical protein